MVDYVELLCLRGVGKLKHAWQDLDYVLSWFWRKEGEAIRAYRKYVERGVDEGRCPELVVGGSVRSFSAISRAVSRMSKR